MSGARQSLWDAGGGSLLRLAAEQLPRRTVEMDPTLVKDDPA